MGISLHHLRHERHHGILLFHHGAGTHLQRVVHADSLGSANLTLAGILEFLDESCRGLCRRMALHPKLYILLVACSPVDVQEETLPEGVKTSIRFLGRIYRINPPQEEIM